MVRQQLVVVHAGSYELCMVNLPILCDVQSIKELFRNLHLSTDLLIHLALLCAVASSIKQMQGSSRASAQALLSVNQACVQLAGLHLGVQGGAHGVCHLSQPLAQLVKADGAIAIRVLHKVSVCDAASCLASSCCHCCGRAVHGQGNCLPCPMPVQGWCRVVGTLS